MSDMHDIEMNRETFWNLIAQAKDKCGEDMDAMARWVEEQLLFMGAKQALCFNDLMYAYVRHAEQFGLWTAANILCGGLSDDGFRDFCAWLVSQGKEVYAAALADPDSLADIAKSADCGLETLNYVGAHAYEKLTGKDAYTQPNRFPGVLAEIKAEAPLGEGINYPYSTEEAAEYLPRLCAKYDVSATGTWNYDCTDIKHALKNEKKSSRVRNRGEAR